MTDREAAWWALHDALPPGWRASCEFHPDEGRWHATAVDVRPRGRRARHEAIDVTGATEVEALEALTRALRLRDRGPLDPSRASERTQSSPPGEV